MDQYFLDKFVVVRSYSAGVHAGIVESVEADRVRLKAGALRLWRWRAAPLALAGQRQDDRRAAFGCEVRLGRW